MAEIRRSGAEVASATSATVGVGGAATAAAVAACCSGPALGPLIVGMLGAGGAVALEGLRPYAVPMLAVSGVAIGFSFWLRRRGAARCTSEPHWSALRVASTSVVWVSALVWIGALVALFWARFA